MRYVDFLPCDNGSTDAMDSCRLAGILALFSYPGFDSSLIRRYVQFRDEQWVGVRHPSEYFSTNHNNFTRDQLIPLVAGLKATNNEMLARFLLNAAKNRKNWAQNTEAGVPGSVKEFPNGPDWLSPSVMNHLRICAGDKPKLSDKIWLGLEIIISSLIDPMMEPNQLICMCKVAGPFYVKMLRFFNPKLDLAIKEYWSKWRNEPELAQFLIENFK